jgi:hypothetical protein
MTTTIWKFGSGFLLCSILHADQVKRMETRMIVTAPYLCNFAKVSLPSTSDHLDVHAQPRSGARKLDRLTQGQVVYVCDENRSWFRVSYGPPETPCGSTKTGGLDVRETRTCKTGWVTRKWVSVISG